MKNMQQSNQNLNQNIPELNHQIRSYEQDSRKSIVQLEKEGNIQELGAKLANLIVKKEKYQLECESKKQEYEGLSGELKVTCVFILRKC